MHVDLPVFPGRKVPATVTRLSFVASLFLLVTFAFGSRLSAQTTRQEAPDQEVVARVGDHEITLLELDLAWEGSDTSSYIRLQQELYDTRRRVLDILIGEYLIGLEAEARGLTKDELVEQELPGRLVPVTDPEVETAYLQVGDQVPGTTPEEKRTSLRGILEQQRASQALHTFMGELKMASGDVRILLNPPRQAVRTRADDPVRGRVDAPVELVEFSDFECPYCQRVRETLEALDARYGEQIRFVFKDFPLSIHPQAFKAAEAANCALEQGRFWEYHDTLFANQDALAVEDLKRYAAALGLNAAEFDTCVDEGKFRDRVQRDMDEGNRYGVSSTPTVFINGRPVIGAVPLEVYDRIIREELAATEPRR